MTKQEAIELENAVDQALSKILGTDCEVSLALTGRIKVDVGGNHIAFNVNDYTPHYIKWHGFYEDMVDYMNKVRQYFEANNDLIQKLVWSYDHQYELTEGE